MSRDVQDVPVHYFVFDLHEVDGESLLARPYAERRALLLEHVGEQGGLRVPLAIDGDAQLALRSSADLGLEGIVAKRLESAYRPGRRSESTRAWHDEGRARRSEPGPAVRAAVDAGGRNRVVTALRRVVANLCRWLVRSLLIRLASAEALNRFGFQPLVRVFEGGVIFVP